MCILSPKLVEAGRHLNINLYTRARVKRFEGTPGNFRVAIYEEPRYVDLEKCKGCGDCAEACPVSLPNPYEEDLALRKAIYRLLDQATPSAFAIDKYGVPPCRAACPLHVNPQGYSALISKGKYKEALDLIREKNPFPGITGRVCTHPCESACNRKDIDEPLAIDLLKRFVDDWVKEHGDDFNPKKAEPNGKKVAIVGSGPSGLLCAYDLALKGYSIMIFEELPEPGGMLRYGIPSYRLPREVLDREIGILKKLGVEFRCNTTVGKDISLNELREQYDAVYIAIGAHISKKLGVEGEDLSGVWGAVEFLREVNAEKLEKLTGKVAVIGGGNAAMDAARTALRLGAEKVTIVYRRTRREMPANPEEVEEAIEEGIDIIFLATPVKIEGNGKVERIVCQRMKLGEPDESGRRRPIPIEGDFFTIDVDIVIPAISQSPQIDRFSGFNITRWKTFEVDELTLQTNIEGVFAGGDAVMGPATFIEAMAQGRKAGISIDRYLRGEDLRVNRDGEWSYESDLTLDKLPHIDPDEVEKIPRAHPRMRSVDERKSSFCEVVLGFDEETAVSEAKRCLHCAGCCECMECVSACQPEAVVHNMVARESTVEVGAVILSPGFDEFDPEVLAEYGYGRYPNVVTSIQFERIMSASGPFSGEILRLSDKKHPHRVAWIQCVGSRDVHKGRGYCSSVCCMYAVKEAVIAKEHSGDLEPTIFYMDMRSYGKDFDKYVDRARDEYGVRFIRARVASVEEDPKTHNLWIKYEDDNGDIQREEFDMVVLSVGLDSTKYAEEIREVFGIDLNEYKFAKTSTFEPLKTNVPGVFVGGAFVGPKDVPETVAQASGVAAEASSLLSPARGTLVRKKEYVPEKNIKNERPRIGVFVCHCGINIGAYVDVPSVVEYAKTLPYVVYAEDNLYTCSQDTQTKIKQMIEEHNLNRVVVAACTPRTHEPLFQETIREAGLNRYLFEMANIRDQNSWVHMHEREAATQKAKDLVRMAVYKASLLEPLENYFIPVDKRALVIGGGIAGMQSALKMAEEGFFVYLVEKEPELGGQARYIHYTVDGSDVQAFLADMINRVEANDNIRVLKGVNIKTIDGFVGNFKTIVECAGEEIELMHGAVIVAVGANEYVPNGDYLYGSDDRVITQRMLEKSLSNGGFSAKNVVMIQCVGSRNDEHPWCSRVCCTEAVKNALRIKELSPDTNVYVLYRDIRTYGFREDYYRKARELGVMFLRFEKDEPPVVERVDGNLEVRIKDPLLKRDIVFEPDLVVLSCGIVPDREANERLAQMLKVPLNED